VVPAHAAASRSGKEEFLLKHHAEAGRTSLYKAISTLQLSPAILKELIIALSRRKNSAVSAGSCCTEPGGEVRALQRPSRQFLGKRKANELVSSGDSSEPVNKRPAPSEGSAPCPRVHRQSRSN
jgi:hypothetical protein